MRLSSRASVESNRRPSCPQVDLQLGEYTIAAHAAQAHDVAMLCLSAAPTLNYDPAAVYAASPEQIRSLDHLKELEPEVLAQVLRKHAESLGTPSSSYQGVRAHLPGLWQAYLDLDNPPAGAGRTRTNRGQVAARLAEEQPAAQSGEARGAALQRHALADVGAVPSGADITAAASTSAGPYPVPAGSGPGAYKRKSSESSPRPGVAAAGPSSPARTPAATRPRIAAQSGELSDQGPGGAGPAGTPLRGSAQGAAALPAHGAATPMQPECAALAPAGPQPCTACTWTYAPVLREPCAVVTHNRSACFCRLCTQCSGSHMCRPVRRTRSKTQADTKKQEEDLATFHAVAQRVGRVRGDIERVFEDPQASIRRVQEEGARNCAPSQLPAACKA